VEVLDYVPGKNAGDCSNDRSEASQPIAASLQAESLTAKPRLAASTKQAIVKDEGHTHSGPRPSGRGRLMRPPSTRTSATLRREQKDGRYSAYEPADPANSRESARLCGSSSPRRENRVPGIRIALICSCQSARAGNGGTKGVGRSSSGTLCERRRARCDTDSVALQYRLASAAPSASTVSGKEAHAVGRLRRHGCAP